MHDEVRGRVEARGNVLDDDSSRSVRKLCQID